MSIFRRLQLMPELKTASALMVAFAVFVMAAGHVHVARHEVCPEHGELVDVPLGELIATGNAAHTPVLQQASHADFEHVHCCFLAEQIAPTPFVLAVHVATLHAEVPTASVGVTSFIRTVDVLANAPKQGPPQIV